MYRRYKLSPFINKQMCATSKRSAPLEEFQKRLIQPLQQTAASSLFSDDPEDQNIMDSEETEPELWSKEKKDQYKKLENLVQLLTDRQSQTFSPAFIFGGL